MANFIQKFENQSAYDAAEHQYPNTSLVGTDIVFEMTAPSFGGLTVKYNIEDPTQEVALFNGGGGSSTSSSTSGSGSGSGGGGALPTTMIVDGNEETPINTWRFETAGEHIVQYTFADNIIPAGFLNSSVATATEAIIGDDITEIADSSAAGGAFANCTSLTSVSLGNGVTSIGNGAFYGCSGLTNIDIPNSVTSIGGAAFGGCTNLINIIVPDSVTSIGGGAFNGCSSLASVSLGNGVTSIDGAAFSYCSSLTGITIPDSVTSIGNGAFERCSGLTSVTVEATTPPTLGGNVFKNTNANMVIYVPAASVNDYKSDWYEYPDQIQPIS